MSEEDKRNSSESENLCVVCFKNVEIYSIGLCEHPVCSECSTRMRVLCKQNECPICRQDMPKVIFTKNVEPFQHMFHTFERTNLQDRKFGILFCTFEVQKAYYKLLEHRCHICEETERNKWPFKTFQQLKDHMRREHELFYCDICSDNLKIFSFERRCYTRQELGHHRRKGDIDNTSHRGHPLCEFCDTRFMDTDDLFRHLRRNHLFCHFCDADGKHQYYNSMDDLKRHFRNEHHLCEEGECKSMPLTAVFRTEIDLKAHITQEHGRYMSKSANKQARTLEVEFTLAPRPRSENIRNKRYNDRRDQRDNRYEEEGAMGYNVEPGGPGGGSENQQQKLFVNPLTSQDFPALGNSTSNITLTTRNYEKFTNAAFNRDDFPSLGGSSTRSTPAVTITTNSASSGNKRAPEVTITRTVKGPGVQQSGSKSKENFPALGGSSSGSSGSSMVRLSVNSNSQDSKAPKVSIHVNHKHNGAITTHITTSASSSIQRPSEAFPALGGTAPVAQPQWVQPKPKKKEEPKSAKVAQCPQLSPSDLSSFPTLSKGKSNISSSNNNIAKKTSTVTMPVSGNWSNLNDINNSTKNAKKANSQTNNSTRGDSSYSSANIALENKLKEMKLVQVKSKKADKTGEDETKSKTKKKKSTKHNTETNNNVQEPQQNNDITQEDKTSKDANSNTKKEPKNGIVKKRSELKIGTLTNTGESSDFSDEFSLLGASKPPPGFSVKPPPGLNPSSFPPLGVSNNLTFTTSSGESYAIMPASTFHQPTNFQSRNQNLIKKFMSVLDNDAIKEFKTYSDLFKNGALPTKTYYEHCKEVLNDSFDEVFPELLVLLPDVSKQQELYRIHTGQSKNNLVVCENCKQVVLKSELKDHYSYHSLDSNFPSLGTAQQHNANAWRK